MSRPEYWKDCTIECERRVTCSRCGRIKNPVGRSAPAEIYGCDSDCPGYREEPTPGHLWPGELAQMDAKEKA